MGRAARVTPVVIAGEPGVAHLECLPLACAPRPRNGDAGARRTNADNAAEDPPSTAAAPRRPRRRKRRIIAALLGLPLEEIAQRAERRRERRMYVRLAAAAALIALSLALEAGVDRVRGELYRNDALLEASLARATAATAAAVAAAQRLGLPDRVRGSGSARPSAGSRRSRRPAATARGCG